MTDYKEEQRNEIEALESIYPEELEVLSTNPFHVFTVTVHAQDQHGFIDDESEASCTIKFSYTDTYPDEVPLMEIESTECISEGDEQILLDLLNEQAEENIGMVMVFTLVSAVQEKLSTLIEEEKERVGEEKIRKERELEEAEQKKFEGTRVTVETFLAWKKKFDAEINEVKKIKATQEAANKKLTGKELFFSDATLDQSDVQFLQEDGGDTVEVDESLFQDMDDLDFEENFQDDED